MEALDVMNNSSNNLVNNVKGKGKGNISNETSPSQQHNTNLNEEEVFVLIHSTHKDHIYLKNLIDLKENIIHVIKRWNILSKDL